METIKNLFLVNEKAFYNRPATDMKTKLANKLRQSTITKLADAFSISPPRNVAQPILNNMQSNMQRRKSKWAQRIDIQRVDKQGWQTLNKKLEKLFDEDGVRKSI